MLYAIEKQDTGWVIYAHGVAILKCAAADMALEVIELASRQLKRSPDEAQLPADAIQDDAHHGRRG